MLNTPNEYLDPVEQVMTQKGNLIVDADELHMVGQFLKQDVPAPSDLRCLINYNRKPERNYYTDFLSGAHEGRFDNINKMPEPLTKYGKHISGPSFKKRSHRQPLYNENAKYPIDFRINSGLASPDPLRNEIEHAQVTGKHKILSIGIPDLSKMCERKFYSNQKSFLMPDSYDPWKIMKAAEQQSKFKKL